MRINEQVEHLRKLAMEWKDYAKEIEIKLDIATSKLHDISAGLVPVDPNTDKWNISTRTQHSAADTLRRLALRAGRKEPDYNFYP